MSGVRQGSRLDHLRELRAEIDRAIASEVEIEKIRDRKRKARAAAERRAAKELAAGVEQARREMERLDEVERIEDTAPTDLVRAWARTQGITVGARGQLSLDLRKQYLAATQQEAS